jgi:YfiH family protein
MASTLITVPTFASGQDGVHHFFGTRRAPVLTLSAAGAPLAPEIVPGAPAVVISVKQVHGTDVLMLDRPVTGSERLEDGWDALITNQARVLLTVRTADCVPVLVQDPVRHVVGAIHAGWRGTVAGIVRKTIERMAQRFGSEPTSLRLAIGPSIGPCCYEVDAPVLERLRDMARDMDIDWREAVEDRGGGKAMLDLRALVRIQAIATGVPLQSVQSVDLCTACHLDLFYSYRREGAVVGTMLSGIMLTGTVRDQQPKASA